MSESESTNYSNLKRYLGVTNRESDERRTRDERTFKLSFSAVLGLKRKSFSDSNNKKRIVFTTVRDV